MKGKLIVIDGSDGSGKATQTKLLIARLKKERKKVLMQDFPKYGKKSAYFVENYLKGKYGSAKEVSPTLASWFYALDRFDSKKELVKKLKDGYLIVSNRYVSANAGHQGGKISNNKKRDEFLDWLDTLEYEICGLPRPNLNIYLNVPWHIGQKLVDEKGKRKYLGGKKRDIHESDSEHLKNAQESYIHLIEIQPNWVKIDCAPEGKILKKEEIHEMIWKKIKNRVL